MATLKTQILDSRAIKSKSGKKPKLGYQQLLDAADGTSIPKPDHWGQLICQRIAKFPQAFQVQWKCRSAVVSGGILYIFKNHQAQEPKQCFTLNDFYSVELAVIDIGEPKWLFKLVRNGPPGTELTEMSTEVIATPPKDLKDEMFAATSHADQQKWIQVLERKVRSRYETSNVVSPSNSDQMESGNQCLTKTLPRGQQAPQTLPSGQQAPQPHPRVNHPSGQSPQLPPLRGSDSTAAGVVGGGLAGSAAVGPPGAPPHRQAETSQTGHVPTVYINREPTTLLEQSMWDGNAIEGERELERQQHFDGTFMMRKSREGNGYTLMVTWKRIIYKYKILPASNNEKVIFDKTSQEFDSLEEILKHYHKNNLPELETTLQQSFRGETAVKPPPPPCKPRYVTMTKKT